MEYAGNITFLVINRNIHRDVTGPIWILSNFADSED